MATQEFGSLSFEGTLNVVLGRSLEPPFPVEQVGNFFFGIDNRSPPRLWIGAPTICFSGKVRACGRENARYWKVGFLQSISHAEWTGYYTNGEKLRYRLNTARGLLKDSEPGSEPGSLFMRRGHELKAVSSSEVYEGDVSDADTPQVGFLREFSGDAFHPHTTPLGKVLGRLSRTEGELHYKTFLAAVNEKSKSILTLAESHWTLTWDGTYDFDTKAWMPKNAATIITHYERDRAEKYENPAMTTVPTPFSLYLEEAKNSWEVMTPKGWVSCGERGLPKSEGYKPNLAKWPAVP